MYYILYEGLKIESNELVYYTAYIIQYTLYSIHYTAYTANPTLCTLYIVKHTNI